MTLQNVVIGILVLIISWLALVPLGFLLYETFRVDGAWSLQNLRDAYTGSQGLAPLINNTVRFALGSTSLSILFGTTMAYIVVRTNAPFRRLAFIAALVPLLLPGILQALAWIFLASPRTGWLNGFTELVFGIRPFDIRSMGGMIWVEGINQSPLVFLLMYAAFRNMDPSMEESALTNGASLSTVIRRITLPLVRPALIAALMIMVVETLQAFEGPTLLGLPGGIAVFTSRIFSLLGTFPPKYGEAGAFAVFLLVLTTIGVYAYSRLGKNAGASETITGKGFRPHTHELGRWRWPMGLFVLLYFTVTTVLPLGVILLMSFLPFYGGLSADILTSLTLNNYRFVFESGTTIQAFINSTVLSTSAAALIMAGMGLAAWFVVRSKARGAWSLDALTFVPIAIPGIVLGVAMLIVYIRLPIGIYGTMWILLLAYCTRYMPYGMRYAMAAMRQVAVELEEAAQASGATNLRTVRRVVFPLVIPGLMAGWIFVVMAAVRELSASILLYAPGTEVLGVLIWEMAEAGRATELSAAGVVIMILMAILAAIGKTIASRFGIADEVDTAR